MKIGDLKEPYRSLALERAKARNKKLSESKILSMDLFFFRPFYKMPEGEKFWVEVDAGLTPEIPKQ